MTTKNQVLDNDEASYESLEKNKINNKKGSNLNKSDIPDDKNYYQSPLKVNHYKESSSISRQYKARSNYHSRQRSMMNKSITASASKANTSMYQTPYKYENYDLQQMTYNIMKDFTQLRISKEEGFMERMKFDVYKRQIKEERVNQLVERSKLRLNEEERIKGFNRLINDANRRTEAMDNLERTKIRLDQDLLNPPKRYKVKEWKEIYEERFQRYYDQNQKKLEMKWEEEKMNNQMQKEEHDLNLCKVKKASRKRIEEGAKRLYEEAMKRKMKLEQKRHQLDIIDYESSIKVKKNKYQPHEYFFAAEEINSNLQQYQKKMGYKQQSRHLNRNMSSINTVNGQKERKNSNQSSTDFNYQRFENSNRNVNSSKTNKMNKSHSVIKEDHPLFDTRKHNYVGTNIDNDTISVNIDQLSELSEEKRKKIEEIALNKLIPKLYERKQQSKLTNDKEEEASQILNLFFANKYCN